MKIVSSLVLVGLAVAMVSLLVGNQKDFAEKHCFMNRIEYVVEVGLGVIIVGKDLIYVLGSLDGNNQ